MISFLTAFGLEALAFTNDSWARLTVGVVLGMVALLISWCVLDTLGVEAVPRFLLRVHVLKDGLVSFTRGLRGRTSEPGSEPGMLEMVITWSKQDRDALLVGFQPSPALEIEGSDAPDAR